MPSTQMSTPASASSAGQPRLEGVRVLCVDDHPDTLALYALVFGQCGAEVTQAASLSAGLEMFEKVRPAIIVADIGLADGDGYTLIKAIRARPREEGGEVPAVAITGHAGRDAVARALEAGYNVHLAKPLDPARLCEVVDHLVRSGRVQKGDDSK